MSIVSVRSSIESQRRLAEVNELIRSELAGERGRVSIRWSQARCGYVIWAGRRSILGLATFQTPDAAVKWAKEAHGVDLTKTRVIG